MDLSTFQELSQNYTAVPVYRRLMADVLTPVSLFLNLRKDAYYPFLLESVEGGEQVARYSFLGRNPYQILRYENSEVTLSKDGSKQVYNKSYFEVLKELTNYHSEPNLPELPRLSGGAVGFSSYDTVRDIESLNNTPTDDLRLPEAVWAFYDEIFAFDHVKQQIIIIKTVFVNEQKNDTVDLYQQAHRKLNELETLVYKSSPETGSFSISPNNLSSNIAQQDFEQMVKQTKKYIYEGDIFQTVLSQRFQTDFVGDRFMLYRALRMVNPSPYLFYLDFKEFALVGSSPEVLVRVQNDTAQLLPIAGTRPRGNTPAQDRQFEQDLLNDPKEIAEHVMLVDLARNDLSRVCRPGSIQLLREQSIERYSHVMHIVSDIRGKLTDDNTAVDALTKSFPAGTVSGAPKIRAMEIIDELEPVKRGPYAGAIGYFDFSGNMDTCIAIRTMVITNSKVFIQAGAGIVADSNPQKEYEETKNKAGALVEALNVALSFAGRKEKP
jgi:anthranilate synthase component 1